MPTARVRLDLELAMSAAGFTSPPLAMSRALAGKRHKRLDEVKGTDVHYSRWLLEDCCLFFTWTEARP